MTIFIQDDYFKNQINDLIEAPIIDDTAVVFIKDSSRRSVSLSYDWSARIYLKYRLFRLMDNPDFKRIPIVVSKLNIGLIMKLRPLLENRIANLNTSKDIFLKCNDDIAKGIYTSLLKECHYMKYFLYFNVEEYCI